MSTSLRLLESSTRKKVQAWLASLQDSGVQGRVTSTRRSRAEQTRLFERFQKGLSSLPAAPPGTSAHEFGTAIDIVFESDEELADAVDQAEEFGLVWAGPADPVHFSNPEPETTDEAETLRREALIGPQPISPLGQTVIETFTPIGVIKSIGSLFFGDPDHICCKK